MKYNESILSNGITVYTCNVPHKKNVLAKVSFRVGSVDEFGTAKQGISHFLEHMMFKGTENRTYKEINNDIERLGASFNASTSKYITNYHVNGMSSGIDTYMDVLSDMVINSIFPENEIENEKDVVKQEILSHNGRIGAVVNDIANKNTFENTPLEGNVLGSFESVNSLTRQDLLNWFNEYYVANNCVISVVGEVDHDKVVELCEFYFSGMEDGKYNLAPKDGIYNVNNEESLHMEGRNSCAFQYSFFNDIKNVRSLKNDIIDDIAELAYGGMTSSPLFDVIREKYGLVYSIGSGVSPSTSYNYKMIGIGGETTKDKIDKLVVSIDGINQNIDDHIDDELLFAAKNTMRYRIGEMFNSNSFFSSMLERMFYIDNVNGLEYYNFDAISNTISDISYEEIRNMLRSNLNDNNNLYIAGDVK